MFPILANAIDSYFNDKVPDVLWLTATAYHLPHEHLQKNNYFLKSALGESKKNKKNTESFSGGYAKVSGFKENTI